MRTYQTVDAWAAPPALRPRLRMVTKGLNAEALIEEMLAAGCSPAEESLKLSAMAMPTAGPGRLASIECQHQEQMISGTLAKADSCAYTVWPFVPARLVRAVEMGAATGTVDRPHTGLAGVRPCATSERWD